MSSFGWNDTTTGKWCFGESHRVRDLHFLGRIVTHLYTGLALALWIEDRRSRTTRVHSPSRTRYALCILLQNGIGFCD